MTTKTLIIGFGHHARRIHFPIISELMHADVVGIVDLKSQKTAIDAYISANQIKIKPFYLEESADLKDLTAYAKKIGVDAVVVSTNPESHVKYVKWALENGLHVLLDKPVSAVAKSSINQNAAAQIHEDYLMLADKLGEARKKHPDIVCEILTQRRYHPAYSLIKQTIEEIYSNTGCPITYYYAFHNDGQLRMPDEIQTIEYHGYKNGNGKASHSGYHFFDLLNWFTAPFIKDKNINELTVKSWANFPDNYINQVGLDTFKRAFPEAPIAQEYDYSGYGEVDVMNTIQLKSNGNFITHAQIDLQHSGVSARSWSRVEGRNLYKGNGRVRHEQHYIDIGPFASISMTSWQSKPFATESINSADLYKPGHEFNLDITICRNSELIGGEAAQTYTLQDIYEPLLNDYSRGHQEDARWNAIAEFFDLIQEGKNSGTSPLAEHALTSLFMTSVYESVSTNKEVNKEF